MRSMSAGEKPAPNRPEWTASLRSLCVVSPAGNNQSTDKHLCKVPLLKAISCGLGSHVLLSYRLGITKYF